MQALCVSLTLLIALPTSFVVPGVGTDPGWMLGLVMARQRHLRFGHDVVFTYGPWGFLDHISLIDLSSALLATAFAVLALIVFWRTVWSAVSPAYGAAVGSGVAVLVSTLAFPVGGPSWLLLMTIVLGVLASVRTGTTSLLRVAAASGGATLLLQIKFSEGLLALVLAGALSVSLRHPVRIACFVVAVPSSFVLWWVLAGQEMGDVLRWLSLSAQIVSGYSGAMYYAEPRAAFGVLVAVLLVLLLGSLVLHELRTGPDRWGYTLLAAGVVLFGLKEGFVRHDLNHQSVFFTLLAVVGVSHLRRSAGGVGRLLLVALACAAAVASLAIARSDAPTATTWGQFAAVVGGGDPGRDLLDTVKVGVRQREAVPVDVLAAVGRRPVHIEPVEMSAAWAYGLNWHPVPVLQSFSAYTPTLDRLEAQALTSAPHMAVLRQAAAVDDRLQAWDPPRYNRALVCSFRPAASGAGWTALLRGPNRCGAAREVRSLSVAAGEAIPVPQVAAHQMLTMSFRPAPSLRRQVLSLVARDPQPLRASFAGHEVRLPRKLAGGPLLARVPSDVGWIGLPAGDQRDVTVSFSESGQLTFRVNDLAA